MSSNSKIVGMAFSSGSLFRVAKDAYARAVVAVPDSAMERDASLTAIVFSVVALEALVNELAFSAKSYDVPIVGSYAALAEEAEAGRGSLQLKYQVLSVAFSGKAYEKGLSPYQDFALLVALRNALIHHKPDEDVIRQSMDTAGQSTWTMQVNKLLPKLRGKAIRSEKDIGYAGMSGLVGTSMAAEWACRTTVAMVQSVYDLVPESAGFFRESLAFLLKYSFTFP